MKKIISLFSVVFLLVISTPAQDMDPEAAKLFNEGNKAGDTGNFEGALTKYNSALKIADDHRIHYQKGIILKKLRRFDDAEEAFKKCINKKPDFAIAYNGIGGTYFSNGKFLEAAEAFKKFAELSTNNAHKKTAREYISRSYTKLGENAKIDGKHPQAIEYFNEAVKHFPLDAAYLLLAEVYVDNLKYDEALEAADKALNNLSKIPKGGPLYYKGKAFLGKGELQKATEAFEAGKKDKNYKDLCEYELKMMKQ